MQQLKLQTFTFPLMTSLTLNAYLTGIQFQTINGNLIKQKYDVMPSTTSLMIGPSYLLPSQTSQTMGTTSA